MARDRETRRAALDIVFDAAPTLAAMGAFAVGAVALIVAATPAAPHLPGLTPLERIIEELPDFTASVAGAGLTVLAVGLQRRLDGAWAAACALLAFLAAYALIRHEHAVAAVLCAGAFVLLVLARRAFYRRAGLASIVRVGGWSRPAAAALMIAAVAALLWASSHAAFVRAPWWSLLLDPHLGRPGRALAAAAIGLAAIALWRFAASPARPALPAPRADELERAWSIFLRAEDARPEAHLAMLGDKSFLFTPDGAAFVMCARSGASLIAMGGPVGARGAWRAALMLLRDDADARSLRPVLYAAPPDLLPDLIDLGFQAQKVGENAVIDLKAFSLEGPKRQNLRNARRRLAEREGATFEMQAPHALRPALAEAMAAVSQAWLAAHKGGEKSFSLGWFDPAYLARHHLALVRVKGRLVAFANIWTTPDKTWAAIDLMRHHPDAAPARTMDFLFAELFLWAQAEGYSKFDLGMAPLSGLAEERHAPAFARLGRLIFERGAALYDFQGLRAFKEKFDPQWEPRYLAAPGAWSLPIVLAEAALLTQAAPSGPPSQRPSD